jgi:uncharacterized integral membrane protein
MSRALLARLSAVSSTAIKSMCVVSFVAMGLAPRSWTWPIVGIYGAIVVGIVLLFAFVVRRELRRAPAPS